MEPLPPPPPHTSSAANSTASVDFGISVLSPVPATGPILYKYLTKGWMDGAVPRQKGRNTSSEVRPASGAGRGCGGVTAGKIINPWHFPLICKTSLTHSTTLARQTGFVLREALRPSGSCVCWRPHPPHCFCPAARWVAFPEIPGIFSFWSRVKHQ